MSVVSSTCNGDDTKQKTLYIKTPLIQSLKLSQIVGSEVFLKLENTQPCGSFKLRGISNMIQTKLSEGCIRLAASSGGNAGLAAAYVARHLRVPLTLYSTRSISQHVRDKLALEGCSLIAEGDVWDEVDAMARKAGEDPSVGYIPPFDHPAIWAGHESVIMEIADQLERKPSLVIVSVGGGGLMVGVSQGMDKVGWGDVPILAMETEGADCYNATVNAGKIVTLPGITSIARCLGALTPCFESYRIYHERPIISRLVSDKQCIEAICHFLDDHCTMVEPACGASIAAIYSGIIKNLQDEGKLPGKLDGPVVLIVCGGVSITIQMLEAWKTKFGVIHPDPKNRISSKV